jgi:hypothetical protein
MFMELQTWAYTYFSYFGSDMQMEEFTQTVYGDQDSLF